MLCSSHFDPQKIFFSPKMLVNDIEFGLKPSDFAHTGYNNFQKIF